MAGVAAAVAVGVGAAAAAASAGYGIYASERANSRAKHAQSKADDLQKKAEEEYNQLEKEIPSVESRLYKLEQFKKVGNLTPELEQQIEQEESELKKIAVDPAYKQAQMEALSKYDEIANEGGLTPEDKAKLNNIKRDIANFEKGQREAILQSAQQRGTLSGGGTLTAQLLAQQEGANRASDMGFDVASDAYKRAMEAIEKRGELAGELRSQDYGEQRDAASAQDVINRFNVGQRTDVQRANTDRKNAAQQYNLEQSQRISDLNTGLTQEQQRAQAAAVEKEFQDKLAVKQGKAGQLAGSASQQAGFAQNAQQAAGNQMAGAIGGIAKVGSSLVDYGLKSTDTGGVASVSQPGYNYQGTEIYNPLTKSWDPTGR